MSIDLEWNKLDSSLSSYLVDVLNRQLSNIERPSFIGPVEVTSLDFGSTCPDVELVDLRDVYRDFLEDDDDVDRGPVKVTESGEDDEGFDGYLERSRVIGKALHTIIYLHTYAMDPMDRLACLPHLLHSPLLSIHGILV